MRPRHSAGEYGVEIRRASPPTHGFNEAPAFSRGIRRSSRRRFHRHGASMRPRHSAGEYGESWAQSDPAFGLQ